MNRDEILEMIVKHTVSSRIEEGTDLIHEVYVNDFVDELLEAINVIQCCVNKDLEKHPIEGVNEFMLTDQEIEDTQFYCAGVEAGNRICESQCIGCDGFQRDYEQ